MRARVVMTGALLVAGFAAGSALAQSSIDRSFKAVSKDCSGIQWSEETLRVYPNIASACQGVETRNGKAYVKFQGTLSKNINHGEQLKIKFKDGGEVTLAPPPETQLYIAGKRTPVAELNRGDSMTFYVAEDRFVADVPEETASAYTTVPISTHPAEETERVAQALPSTASELPLVALSGLLLLGVGAGLTVRRLSR
jgi:hypothetical protein